MTGLSVEAGETLAFAEPPVPLGAGTELAACVVVAPRLLPAEAAQLTADDDVTVSLLALVPIYAAELELARREGAEALVERLDAAGVTELLESGAPGRRGRPARRARGAREGRRRARGAAAPARDRGAARAARPRAARDEARAARADRPPAAVRQRQPVRREHARDARGAPVRARDVVGARGARVVRAGDVRESLGDVRPRERVAEFAAVGSAPASAGAQVTELEARASEALGRVSEALFRGRVAELAVDLAADEQVRHFSDGKLGGVNGLVVLTDRRLFFLGEAIRRSKRREETIPVERIATTRCARACARRSPSPSTTAEEIELRLGRAETRRLGERARGRQSNGDRRLRRGRR